MDQGYYYSPFQYELREGLVTQDGELGNLANALAVARRVLPAPVVAGVTASVVFLAYTPLLQPGPPARRGDPFTLPTITLGGGLIV